MELSMSERRAVTKVAATRYVRADRAGKKQILDELADTGTVTKATKARLKRENRPTEPGRHPTPDPGPLQRAPDPDHRKTRRQEAARHPGKIR
jgi:hypothetical protein